jgi:hypothetical protein
MKPTSNLCKSLLAASCVLALSFGTIHAAGAAKTHSESGVIKSVDTGTHTLLITAGNDHSELSFRWNDHTKFTAGHKTLSASALKKGQSVNLAYAPGGDTPTLQRVRLATKAPKHTAAHPTSHPHVG